MIIKRSTFYGLLLSISISPFLITDVAIADTTTKNKVTPFATENLKPGQWVLKDGNWYFINSNNGNIHTGWIKIDATWYYLNPNGIMQKGWQLIEGKWYYLNNSGAMLTGWNQIGGTWYFLNNSGAMLTGWNQIGGTWYFLNNSGAMLTGWNQIGGTWYFLNNSGAMQKGWLQLNGTWYFLNNSGAMLTGWNQIGGTWYFLNNSGAMQKGWLQLNGTWYFLNNSGAMLTGLVTLAGKDYILDSNGAWLPQALSALPTKHLLLPNSNSGIRSKQMTNIVIHFTSNAALTPRNPYVVQDIYRTFVNYGVSAHYMIGRNGEIYLLVPENRIAYHAGKGSLIHFPLIKDQLNEYSIGIEMMAIGTEQEMTSMVPSALYKQIAPSNIGYTAAQYNALNQLLTDITRRNPSIKRNRHSIVGHDEYAPGRKSDPGSLFNWSKIGF